MSSTARVVFMCVVSALMLVPLMVIAFTMHSMTLLVESYHMMYNVLSLIGCLVSLRMSSAGGSKRNTFGWSRVEVLTSVMSLLFLAALGFSVTVESLQVLVEGLPDDLTYGVLYIMGSSVAVLFVNFLCYLLVGGYTNLQSSFLTVNESGEAQLPDLFLGDKEVVQDKSVTPPQSSATVRRLIWFFTRDLSGAFLTVLCALIAYFQDVGVMRFVDPLLALLSVGLLLVTSRPLISAGSMVLLQAIPLPLDVPQLALQLRTNFPQLLDVHELHVWPLTPVRTIATAHVVFSSPADYRAVADQLTRFFCANGIDHVTVQPEFRRDLALKTVQLDDLSSCLIGCSTDACSESRCCRTSSPCVPDVVVTAEGSNGVELRADCSAVAG